MAVSYRIELFKLELNLKIYLEELRREENLLYSFSNFGILWCNRMIKAREKWTV
jgi:hypothetical protein